MRDDATSELSARFALSDSTSRNLRLSGECLERHGRPPESYTDRASLFVVNRPLHSNKHLPAEAPKRQAKRALEELGIGWPAAHPPPSTSAWERRTGKAERRLGILPHRADSEQVRN